MDQTRSTNSPPQPQPLPSLQVYAIQLSQEWYLALHQREQPLTPFNSYSTKKRQNWRETVGNIQFQCCVCFPGDHVATKFTRANICKVLHDQQHLNNNAFVYLHPSYLLAVPAPTPTPPLGNKNEKVKTPQEQLLPTLSSFLLSLVGIDWQQTDHNKVVEELWVNPESATCVASAYYICQQEGHCQYRVLQAHYLLQQENNHHMMVIMGLTKQTYPSLSQLTESVLSIFWFTTTRVGITWPLFLEHVNLDTSIRERFFPRQHARWQRPCPNYDRWAACSTATG